MPRKIAALEPLRHILNPDCCLRQWALSDRIRRGEPWVADTRVGVLATIALLAAAATTLLVQILLFSHQPGWSIIMACDDKPFK